jgi:hypothetical protein
MLLEYIRLFFAGIPEVVEVAKRFKKFDEYFVGGNQKVLKK